MIVRSTDGGASWTITNSNMAAHVNDVTFVGEARWVAVGLLGKAAYSTDGGQSWTLSSAPTRKTLEGVASAGSESVILRMSYDDEPVDSITITSLDPDRQLTASSGRRQHTFTSQSIADSTTVAVVIDAHRVVTEAAEGNNARQAKLVCPD